MVHDTLELRVFWRDTLLAVEHLRHAVTIGESKRATFFVSSEDLPCDDFPLVRHEAGEYTLTFCEGMTGEAQRGEDVYPLHDAPWAIADGDCGSLTLTPATFATAQWSGLTFAMRLVDAPPPLSAARELDFPFLSLLFLAGFLMAGAILTLSLYPYETERLDDTLFTSNTRFARTLLEPEKPQQRSDRDAVKDEKPNAVVGKRTPTLSKRSTHGTRVDVLDVGVLRVLDIRGGALAQILGDGAAFNADTRTAIGALVAPGSVASGMGLHAGVDTGAEHSLSGSIDTIGRAGGRADYGGAQGDIGAKRETAIAIQERPPTFVGSLDPAQIKRVLQDNRNAIRFCYERELQIHHDLTGMIQVQFVIGSEGKVTTAKVARSTIDDAEVERCLVDKIRTLLFAKPAGGGVVVVNYPFTFVAQ